MAGPITYCRAVYEIEADLDAGLDVPLSRGRVIDKASEWVRVLDTKRTDGREQFLPYTSRAELLVIIDQLTQSRP